MNSYEARKLVGASSGGVAVHDTMVALGIENGVRIYRNRTFNEYADVHVEGGAVLLKFTRGGRFLIAVTARLVVLVDAKASQVLDTHEILCDPPVSLDVGSHIIGVSQCGTALDHGAANVYVLAITQDRPGLRLLHRREVACDLDARIALVAESMHVRDRCCARFVISYGGAHAEVLDILNSESA